jgi:hypothetical protein
MSKSSRWVPFLVIACLFGVTVYARDPVCIPTLRGGAQPKVVDPTASLPAASATLCGFYPDYYLKCIPRWRQAVSQVKIPRWLLFITI